MMNDAPARLLPSFAFCITRARMGLAARGIGRMRLRSRKDVTLIGEMAVDFTLEANKAFFAGEHYFMQMEDSREDDLFLARRNTGRRRGQGEWNLHEAERRNVP